MLLTLIPEDKYRSIKYISSRRVFALTDLYDKAGSHPVSQSHFVV